MDNNQIRSIITGFFSWEKPVSYHEMDILLCFGCLLRLKMANQVKFLSDALFFHGPTTAELKEKALHTLQQTDCKMYRLVASHLPFSPETKEEERIWDTAIRLFQALERRQCLNGQEDIALAFRELLYALSESSSPLAEFTTPRDIVSLMSILIQHDNNASQKERAAILDPACGTGGFLSQALHTLHNSSRSPDFRLSAEGFTNDRKIADLCSVGLSLVGDRSDYSIQRGSPNPPQQQQPAKFSEKFDFVISHIPFGNRQEHLHLQAMMQAAAPNASVIALIPNGVLFRMGPDERLRHEWIKNNQLDTLIYLPDNLLYSTRIPVSIIQLKHTREADAPVRLLDLYHGQVMGKKQSQLGEELLEEARQALASRTSSDSRCRFVTRDEIEKNNYILTRERYFSKFDATANQPQSVSLPDILAIQTELEDTQRQLERYYRRLDRDFDKS